MSQHFLLSAEARTLSLAKLLSFSDCEARAMFARIRWNSETEQVCPHCSAVREHYFRERQDRWRCRDCKEYFSVTSGTVFSSAKLPLQKILAAIALFSNAVKGISACQLMRDLDVQYKTALVLLHKVRESLWLKQDLTKFSGTVEVDGAYMHTYRRPRNRKEDRPDRRLVENQNPEKCSVLVIRQRGGKDGEGAARSRIVVLPSENAKDVMAAVLANVEVGSTIVTDEAQGFTELGLKYAHQVVSHSEEFSTADGVNENQAESYIARFRRLLFGQIHKLKRKYLDVYAYEIAFREDTRREPNGTIFDRILQACLRTSPSRDWSKYWQGNKRVHDSVVSFVDGKAVYSIYEEAPKQAASKPVEELPAVTPVEGTDW